MRFNLNLLTFDYSKSKSMKKITVFIVLLTTLPQLFSQQWEKASLNDDMTIRVEKVNAAFIQSNKTEANQIPGFPIAVPANQSFKNMRNVALADMNGDHIEDIIFAADGKLYVYTYQGLLWSQNLIGTAIYPPSIGDIDGDGFLDIVQVTGGSPANGRIFVFDRQGNVLSGWPVNFNNNWIICAPALSDIDNDNKMEIICNERLTNGKVHILKFDGTEYSANWPCYSRWNSFHNSFCCGRRWRRSKRDHSLFHQIALYFWLGRTSQTRVSTNHKSKPIIQLSITHSGEFRQ